MITAHRRNRFAHGLLGPTPEQVDFMTYWQSELEKLSTEQIILWAGEMFHSRLALLTSCGIGGSILISFLGRMKMNVSVINADVGSHFGETKRLHEHLEKRYGIRIEIGSSAFAGKESFLCCGERKYHVLRQTARRFDAWISESWQPLSPDAPKLSVLDWDDRFGLFRVSPLIRWTAQSLRNKAGRESIPFDEFSGRGYFDDDCDACLTGRMNETTANGKFHCCCQL